MLTQFLKRFDRSMNNRRLECSNLRCEDEICEGMNEFQIVQWREEGWRASHYGMITITSRITFATAALRVAILIFAGVVISFDCQGCTEINTC